jgi:hypothetical protein
MQPKKRRETTEDKAMVGVASLFSSYNTRVSDAIVRGSHI